MSRDRIDGSLEQDSSPQARTRADLAQLHDVDNLSWRRIAGLEKYCGISHATLDAIYHGRVSVPLKVRKQLGWPLAATVIVVGDGGVIPDGTQALLARQCPCGQWFIPNSGNRRRCFICSPFRKRKKKESE